MSEIDKVDLLDGSATLADVLEQLRGAGVRVVRLTYSDLHGTARGKEFPLRLLESVIADGASFCVANLSDGLASNPTNAPGQAPDRGYPDMRARPLLATLTRLPWDTEVAWMLAEIEDSQGLVAHAPRNLLRRVVERYAKLGLKAIIGPELEFFLLRTGEDGRFERYIDQHSMVYTAGKRSDPQGVVRAMLLAADEMGLLATAANHEFARGQYELNLLHSEALDAADRTFRLKALVKEVAERHGLLATFMGRPFNDDGGSGFHLHVSLNDQAGTNLFADSTSPAGLSVLARHFLAGVLEHAPALMAFLAPTINAYKRLLPDSLVPTAANWAFDNRTSFVRVPAERGRATRLEARAGDASANPYLAISALLLAGLDGIERSLEPPDAVDGDVSIGEIVGTPLPRSLEASLAALRADDVLSAAIGAPLLNAFCAMKEVEIERFRTYVTEWELREYAWHL
ncbi:MAG TPA: glutamine synthetase family protein [Ktedonobacteraceae bacterium]|nr:glutamine synthetase family protein [Ktedonobacteraceae bacterium]